MGETVLSMVSCLSESMGVSEEEAAAQLYDRMVLGEVRFVDPDPPRGFAVFLVSWYSAWFWLVVFGLAGMVLSIYVLPQVAPFSWLRVGLGLVSSLYLPGYAFIEAVYPKRDDLEELERFALGVGLSIALTPLVGFVLNYTPWGIRLDPITVGLSIVTLVFGIGGVYRKYQYHLLGLELRTDG